LKKKKIVDVKSDDSFVTPCTSLVFLYLDRSDKIAHAICLCNLLSS